MYLDGALPLGRALPEAASGAALMLTAGGDERIAPDPATGRNRYGVSATPRPDEVCFSSTTASSMTPRAFRAVEAAWTGLTADAGGKARIDFWFDILRARLLALFGIAGSEVVLTASGTEAELAALAVARSIAPGPFANILIAPAETGSGVPRAAAGAHFLNSSPFGMSGRAGAPLAGWEDADIAVSAIDIRDAEGRVRPAQTIDAEAATRAQRALADGRNVLLHRLETSKTGLSGLSEDAAAEIAASAPDRVVVLVDCCQLRAPRRRIRRYLERGFMVAITGSKFFGGPPFSGALLLPPAVLARVDRLALPAGLADYASRFDWPAGLRARTRLEWANEANLGLGLRWVAALEEMERYYSAPEELRRKVLARFMNCVRERSQTAANLQLLRDSPLASSEPDSILSFVMTHPGGAPYAWTEAGAIHGRLRAPEDVFHLGQPVAIGSRTALRVAASAPIVNDVIERVAAGKTIDGALSNWVNDVDALFGKWGRLMRAG
jgi:hypothetical protein